MMGIWYNLKQQIEANTMFPKRNLAVGHFYNGPFQEACSRHLPRIREVFFAWPGVLS